MSFILKYSWEDISVSRKERIKKDVNVVNNGLKDKKEALVRLFEDYNMYMGGNYGASSVTCGKCVTNVLKAFNKKIKQDG